MRIAQWLSAWSCLGKAMGAASRCRFDPRTFICCNVFTPFDLLVDLELDLGLLLIFLYCTRKQREREKLCACVCECERGRKKPLKNQSLYICHTTCLWVLTKSHRLNCTHLLKNHCRYFPITSIQLGYFWFYL